MTLTLEKIKKYINNWQSIRGQADTLKSYLFLAESFSYTNPFDSVDAFHVYPGVCFKSEKLYMFLVSAQADARKDYSQIITTVVDLNLTIGEEPLPTKVAIKRIENWRLHKFSWIDKQAQIEGGVFTAFNLPSDYMRKGVEYETFFALEENSVSPTGFTADLITMRKDFYDVVRPVPPFPPDTFNLLS